MTNNEGESILDAARQAVKDRGEDYEDPAIHFRKVSVVWTVLLDNKLKPGEGLSEIDVLLLMDALKSVRLAHNQKHTDSAVDKAGYISLMEKFL